MPELMLTCIDCDWTGPPEQCVIVCKVLPLCPICGAECEEIEEETPLFVEGAT